MLPPRRLDHQVKERVVMLRWEGRTKDEVREVEAAVDDNVVMTITVCPESLSGSYELMVKKRDIVCVEQTANTSTMPMSSSQHRR
jgi:hypothetical protein